MMTLFVLMTVAVSTGQLCLGLWIGAKFGKARASRRQIQFVRFDERRPSADVVEVPCWIGTVDGVTRQARRLVTVSSQYQPPIPQEIVTAIGDLSDAIQSLRKQLCTRHSITPRDLRDEPAPRPETSDEVPAAAAATDFSENRPLPPGAEHPMFNVDVGSPRPAAEPPRTFTYSALEYMAPCNERDLPTHDSFRAVRCHSLSSTGIAFLVDQPPDYVFLTISVGTPPELTFIVSRVRQCRQIPGTRRPQYLVNCEFVRKLSPGELRWQTPPRPAARAT